MPAKNTDQPLLGKSTIKVDIETRRMVSLAVDRMRHQTKDRQYTAAQLLRQLLRKDFPDVVEFIEKEEA